MKRALMSLGIPPTGFGRIYLLLFVSVTVTSCAAVQSQVVTGKTPDGTLVTGKTTPDGIPYFLPRRPFVITVSAPAGGGITSAITITAAPGNAEPDLTTKFALSQGLNLLANNEFNVTVGSNGLLQSSQSTAISQVATAVQNAAASAGMFIAPLPVPSAAAFHTNVALLGAAGLPLGPKIACPAAGTSYQYIDYPETHYATALTFCPEGPISYTVTWDRADHKTGPYAPDNVNASPNTHHRLSGLFFRHELPYIIRIKGTAIPSGVSSTENDFVITSPDESETDFFPINRSFFANNTANITVTDGVITAVDQTTQSEIAAAVGLPATWVSSYTTAVGNLLSGLSSINSDKQTLLQQLQATAAAQAQYLACRKTVGSYDFSSPMTTAQAAAAAAAIKAACPGS